MLSLLSLNYYCRNSIPHATPPSNLNTSQSGTPVGTPGISGTPTSSHSNPIGVGHSPTRESPLITENIGLHNDNALDAPSTSPTSSYPISTGVTSSPLNPATSTPTNASDIEGAETTKVDADTTSGTGAHHPGTVDLTTIPGVHKSDLPTTHTPMSGEEADTEMA